MTEEQREKEVAAIRDDILSNLLPGTKMIVEGVARKGDLKRLGLIQERLTSLIQTYHQHGARDDDDETETG